MAAANAHHRCGAVNLRSKQSRFYLYLWLHLHVLSRLEQILKVLHGSNTRIFIVSTVLLDTLQNSSRSLAVTNTGRGMSCTDGAV